MAKALSKMIPLGTKAPDFYLLDVCSNQMRSLQELKSDTATVIMFICNHCPYVKHIQSQLVKFVKTYQAKNIAFIAINSNDINAYPDDAPDQMRAEAFRHEYSFPYLYDETQAVAIAYDAACTPDFYVFNRELECVYRGRFDDATPGTQLPITGKDLGGALDNILANRPISKEQQMSVGCSIKWKKPTD